MNAMDDNAYQRFLALVHAAGTKASAQLDSSDYRELDQLLAHQVSLPVLDGESWFSEYTGHLLAIAASAKHVATNRGTIPAASDLAEAIRTCRIMLGLSRACRNGGLLVGFFTSLQLEMLALRTIAGLFSAGDPEGNPIASLLDRYELDRESYCDIARRDLAWSQKAGCASTVLCCSKHAICDGLSGRVDCVGKQLAHSDESVGRLIPCSHCHDLVLLSLCRLVRVDLMLRQFLEHRKQLPARLQDLDAIESRSLMDPFTESLFVYHRCTANAFTLYGTGPRVDARLNQPGTIRQVFEGHGHIAVCTLFMIDED